MIADRDVLGADDLHTDVDPHVLTEMPQARPVVGTPQAIAAAPGIGTISANHKLSKTPSAFLIVYSSTSGRAPQEPASSASS